MNAPRLTLLGSQHQALVDFLGAHPSGHERAAAVLFKRLHIHVAGLPDSDRYIAKEVHLLNAGVVTSSSGIHVAFDIAPLRELFRRCEEDNLVFGFVHNHPDGNATFSSIDEENECTLLSSISNRNGRDITFVAILWAEGKWIAQVRSGKNPPVAINARHVAVVADKITVYGNNESTSDHAETQARQAAAFGKPFVDMSQTLRVAFVGTGGTGSPGATLAARSGFGEIVLIDKDILAKSNLNRVRGLSSKDVGHPKAGRLKQFIDGLGLSVRVGALEVMLDESADAVDALASCDIAIGCTDDFIGREILNIGVYAYALMLIDVGLGGRIGNGPDGMPILRNHFARVSTVGPEFGQCLFCQGVLRDVWIRTQYALRQDPNLTIEEISERYLENGNTDAPGVGPFTSAAADFAIATLFDLLKPFRRFPPEVRRDLFIVDFVMMEIRSPAGAADPDCPYCVRRDFLIMNEPHRLMRPSLGERIEYC